MENQRLYDDARGYATLDEAETELLGAARERELLNDLADCKAKLAKALHALRGVETPEAADDPAALSQYISSWHASNAAEEARLGAVFRRYTELRGKLAMANMRLVAHVAKRFRDRGVPYGDLIQEGFCGLLEAIDRFDTAHGTKLATYATWWIRQAMQRVVAGCAYPVRLSPRHLRQLAQSQDQQEKSQQGSRRMRVEDDAQPASELVQRIFTATRPTISLDTSYETESSFSLLQTMSDPEGDRTDEFDMSETIARLFESLRPREQQVLGLRFGLGGTSRLSLSQVGKELGISKERVRQIQDRALQKLRAAAEEHRIDPLLMLSSV